MNQLITSELIRTIQEERLMQAQRRRTRSRLLARGPKDEQGALRMALGPGTQFVGVTEQILDTVTDRAPRSAAA